MAKEFVWGCELNAKNKTVIWDMLDCPLYAEAPINFNLLIKTAVLGSSALKGQDNVIELETVALLGDQIRQPLVRLTRGLHEQRTVDLLISHPGTKFRLVEGDGPVYIWGQHMLELGGDHSQLDESLQSGPGCEIEEEEEHDEDYVKSEEDDDVSDPEISDEDIGQEEVTLLEVESVLPIKDLIRTNMADANANKKRANTDVAENEAPIKIAKLDDSADECGDAGKPASRLPKVSDELQKEGGGYESTSSKDEVPRKTTIRKKNKGRSKKAVNE